MAEVKKYELITDDKINWFGRTLFRIKALISFTMSTGETVNVGDLGGYIEKEDNLSQVGNAWVYGNAKVYGNAEVYGNAKVYGNAWVYGNAKVYGNAEVCGDAEVYGDAEVCGNADYLCVKGLGRENRNTTFYKTKDGGVSVACGCFSDTLTEFEAKVKETHKDTKYEKEYLIAVEMAKIHFEL